MSNEDLEVLVGEITLSYTSQIRISSRPILKDAECVYQVFLQTWDISKIELLEQFRVMLLNRANRVLGICTLTSGNVTGTIADPKQVFAVALKANAVNVIIAHNHPSGCLNPSKADEELTRKMKLAGEYLDIKVIDHLIVTTEGYFSFADEGLI